MTPVLRTAWLLAATMLLALVAGCGSSTPPVADSVAPTELAPAAPQAPPRDVSTKADVITTGDIRMTVADPLAAADTIVAATIGAGGRVQSRSVNSGAGLPNVQLILRIPSDRLDALLADLDGLGAVDSMNINYDDVTAQRVDLDARITALRTSVNRLLDLMNRAKTTSELLEAETSLTARQADLDSLTAQRAALADQISYATLTADLSSRPEAIAPGGFPGAIHDGWQALVNTAAALAGLAGFLLPWIPVLAVLGALLWLLLRWLRRRGPRAGWVAPPAAEVAGQQQGPHPGESGQ